MPGETQITTISPDDFDALFNDGVVGASKDSSLKTNDKSPIVIGNHELPLVNMEELEKEPVKEEVKETKEAPDEKTEETKVEDKKEDEVKETSTEIKEALKNTVGFLIEKGLWDKFEGWEDAEFDDDSYAELALAQNQRQIDKTVSEILDSTGEYGKAIINHIRQGNNPDELIDIFKEQKRIESLGNIDTPESKKQYVKEFYINTKNFSEAKAEKWVNNLIEDDTLDSEVDEIKENYKELHQQQREAIKQEQEEFEKAQEKRKEETRINLTKAIDDNQDFTKEEKKMLKNGLFRFNKKLDNGNLANEFVVKSLEMQRDPKQYIDLVRFVLDRKGYEEKLKQTGGSEQQKKTWNFIKANGAVDKKAPESKEEIRDNKNTYKGTNFKFI